MAIFSEEISTQIRAYLDRYETKRSAILPVLHLIQDNYEWIQPQHIDALESEFGLSRVHVQEVASFYSMYRLEKPKPFRILVCDNLVCTIAGAQKTMTCIRKHMQAIEEAGRECPFSLEGVPCLGVCDGAPAMLVNKERFLKVNEANVETILSKYQR